MEEISVVINTLNEEKNLPPAIFSVKSFADEIVVVDMESSDSTVKIAQKLGAKVYSYKKTGYVEPARNFALSKATKDWIFVLDADEEVSPALAKRLKEIIKNPTADYYRIPRKNIIFSKWIEHCLWWPDYQIRFFKKGKVSWNEVIHGVPMTSGKGEDLPSKESYSIIHKNYNSIEQYLARMDRYTTIQARLKIKEGYRLIWKDLISKPVKEFLARYFVGEGYKDGLHGLSLSFLQAFSELILYLKIWQGEKFQTQAISLDEASEEFAKVGKETNWWILETHVKSKYFLKTIPQRIQKFFSR